MNATERAPSKKAEGLELGYTQTMLVRFLCASREEVLGGIPEMARAKQEDLDEKHLNQLKLEQISVKRAERDRIRPGHIDTGFPVYTGETVVSLPTFAEAMIRSEYGFRDVHFFEQLKGKKLFVVVFAFEYCAPSAENIDELNRMFSHYACNSWTVNVWDNPNLTATVNCTNRVRGVRTERKLVVGSKRVRIV